MTPTAPATGNRLLAALAPGELDRIAPHLERIELRRGAILHEPPGQLAEVWFPEGCVISVVVVVNGGGLAESAVIGREGVAGLADALGSRRASARCLVQVPGPGAPPRARPARGRPRGEPAAAAAPRLVRAGVPGRGHGLGGLPRAPRGRGPAGALAAAGPGPRRRRRRAAADPGVPGADAGPAAHDRDRDRERPAAGRPDRLPARAARDPRPARARGGGLRLLPDDPRRLRRARGRRREPRWRLSRCGYACSARASTPRSWAVWNCTPTKWPSGCSTLGWPAGVWAGPSGPRRRACSGSAASPSTTWALADSSRARGRRPPCRSPASSPATAPG